jgi:hypothetical protein
MKNASDCQAARALSVSVSSFILLPSSFIKEGAEAGTWVWFVTDNLHLSAGPKAGAPPRETREGSCLKFGAACGLRAGGKMVDDAFRDA